MVESKKYQTETGVRIFEDGRPKQKLHQISYTRTRLDYGFVKFKVLTPDFLEKRLVEAEEYETDQESFVTFLQTGILRCKDGSKHDFAEKLSQKFTSRRVEEYAQAEIGI